MIHGLDLFSGIGGIGLALSPWVRTIAYCESDRYAQSVLLSRMQSGDIDCAPIWDDVRTLKKEMLPKIDIIFGGFPCQDISVAGNGVGLDGKRSGLFFEIVRLIEAIQPTFIFLENVPAIRTRGLDRVCFELASLGYDLRWTVISASSVGACHQRERWFLLAHSNSLHLRKQHKSKLDEQAFGINATSEQGHAANSLCEGLERYGKQREVSGANKQAFGFSGSGDGKELSRPVGYGGWKSEPTTRGRDHGVQNRVDRLRCLGNSVVPLQAQKAFEKLIGGVQ